MLRSLSLANFRNHSQFLLKTPPEGLMIAGKNGSGKTSILEAIYTFVTLKSFRSKDPFLCITHGQKQTKIFAETDQETFLFYWRKSQKKKTELWYNSVLHSATEILKKKHLFAVLFSPEDILLPYTTPEQRRRYMNRVLVPLFPIHFQSLRKFAKVLKTRNALLKRISEGFAQKDELEFYDQILSAESQNITKKRETFFSTISENVKNYYKAISGSKDILSIIFQPNIEGNVFSVLKKYQTRDISRKVTMSGAHLDDFFFLLRGAPLKETGSRGEVRSAILALKMAEKMYIESITASHPILLLDDVFSELDAHRRKYLVELVSGAQTFITTTDVPSRAGQKMSMDVYHLKEDLKKLDF